MSDNQKHSTGARRSNGGRRRKKKNTAGRMLVVVLGFLAILLVVIGGLIAIFVRPPEVDPGRDPVEPGPSIETGGEVKPEKKPKPVVKRERKEECYTFLVCGTDKDGTRTDTIMVATYDVNNKAVKVCSIPRDTMSNVSYRKLKKINAAFSKNIEELELEVEQLLGYPIDRYVVINYNGFAEVVDAIGGVEYDVPMDMYHEDGETVIDLKKGRQVLNGEKALQYVRFRSGYADQDLGRIHAQQNFIKAVARQLLSPSSLLNITDIAEAVFNNTKTNMSLGEMAWFASKALGLDMKNITFGTLPGESQYLYEAELGYNQWYFVPHEQEILDMVNSGLNPYTTDITDLDLIDITKYSPGK